MSGGVAVMMVLAFVFVLLAFVVGLIVLTSGEKAEPPPNTKTIWVSKNINYGRHKITGVSFKNLDGTNRQTIIRKCVRLADHRSEKDVSFFADIETGNEFDSNAVSVYAEENWETRSGETREKFLGVIGYLPKELSAKIASDRQGIDKVTTVSVSEPSFGELINEKGKQLVGVSFNVQLEWIEIEVQDLNEVTGTQNA